MQFPFSEQSRLMILIVTCALLWSLESFVPLSGYARDRYWRAVPNIALTVLLAMTNLLLSMLHKTGVDLERLGDSTTPLADL